MSFFNSLDDVFQTPFSEPEVEVSSCGFSCFMPDNNATDIVLFEMPLSLASSPQLYTSSNLVHELSATIFSQNYILSDANQYYCNLVPVAAFAAFYFPSLCFSSRISIEAK